MRAMFESVDWENRAFQAYFLIDSTISFGQVLDLDATRPTFIGAISHSDDEQSISTSKSTTATLLAKSCLVDTIEDLR